MAIVKEQEAVVPREAILYKKLKKNYVQCTACHHWCAIKPVENGKCGVRVNINGKLYLAVYGYPAAINVDPVEKKPLFHFLPGELILSLGTVGCNFFCAFCQNWDISQWRHIKVTEDGRVTGVRGVYVPPEGVVALAKRYNSRLIAYTYNEPTVWVEYAYDIAKLAVQEGMRNVFVSSGFETHHLWDLMGDYLHAINVDLKSFSDKFYKEICGTRLKPVLENIEFLGTKMKGKIWMEITTLIIDGYNDSEAELREIARFIASVNKDIPWHITAAHPDYKMTEIKHTPLKTLLRAYEIGKEEGLNYVYVGNVSDPKHSSTYCPNCGELLIWRDWYRVVELWKERGKCHKCGTQIAGIWQ